LIDAGYLKRQKYLYGIPYMYTLSHKGRILLGANKREDRIRVDRIAHDIYILEAIAYFVLKYGVSIADVESEKELHIKDGFGIRKHQPDFGFLLLVNASPLRWSLTQSRKTVWRKISGKIT